MNAGKIEYTYVQIKIAMINIKSIQAQLTNALIVIVATN